MTVIAVPVTYFVLMAWAQPNAPVQSSHSPRDRKFARIRIEATGTITISLRILIDGHDHIHLSMHTSTGSIVARRQPGRKAFFEMELPPACR